MKKSPIRFLKVSLALVSLLCVLIFSFMTVYMDRMSSATIRDIGTIYMSGMNERISMHFATTVELRLSQVSSIARDNPPESAGMDVLRGQLAYSAEVRDFDYLAFYSGEGAFDTLYGETMEVLDPAPFRASLDKGECKIAVGNSASGERVVLLGVPAAYPMEGGESVALVAGVPASYIQNVLFLDEEESLVYSHIIRKDGSFVIRGGDAYRDNYFDRIRSIFRELGGENEEQYIEELAEAMESGQE